MYLPTRISIPLLRCALTALAALLAAPVAAQWAWRDETGRMVFSDRPPPASVRPAQIVRQPPAGALAVPDAAPDTSPRGAPSAAPRPPTFAEREMEARKRQAERAEAEKKQADEQALAARKAQECERARGYLRALEDGLRIARTNAQGEREFLDDTQRAAEIARTREIIGQTCGS